MAGACDPESQGVAMERAGQGEGVARAGRAERTPSGRATAGSTSRALKWRSSRASRCGRWGGGGGECRREGLQQREDPLELRVCPRIPGALLYRPESGMSVATEFVSAQPHRPPLS